MILIILPIAIGVVTLVKLLLSEDKLSDSIEAFVVEEKLGKSVRGMLTLVQILLLVLFSTVLVDTIRKKSDKKQEIIEQEALVFADSVANYIDELNIKHPDIVLRQAILESGNFQSKVFKENNNMFGFKQAYKRPNTQIGVNRGYAVYENWQECVIDYALYQTYSAKNLSKEAYIKFLGRNFAEDPEYSNKIDVK